MTVAETLDALRASGARVWLSVNGKVFVATEQSLTVFGFVQ